ncbi:hypothetical protein [Cytobacillus gottheilii]|uniref:Sigma-70 family RNA polymerase sigma factor n=1 Tax=Cytobacillus gottheilii TaxID=859144 RepID=A0ABX8FG31_9BACI|nr:hypothetical protein [Cytobacillus gottheilii]QVY62950.1 sigma-70 family RNA polymerase sigma factor [Cytobacillus gottheilii]
MNVENLIMEYQETKSDAVFTQIYETLAVKFLKEGDYRQAVARSIGADEHELQEIFDDCVMYTVGNYDGSRSFEAYFKWKFRNMRANFLRDKNTDRQVHLNAIHLDDDENTTLELVDAANVEQEVVKTTEADQRQLIDSLTKDIDATTTAIVEALPRYASVNALGKALGMHHEVVKRSLKKLAKNYDVNKFGDYRQYLQAI